jgi:hypothetical protein
MRKSCAQAVCGLGFGLGQVWGLCTEHFGRVTERVHKTLFSYSVIGVFYEQLSTVVFAFSPQTIQLFSPSSTPPIRVTTNFKPYIFVNS